MQKITPFLWFNSNAEEAIQFYLDLFKDSSIVNKQYYGEGAPQPKGTLLTVTLKLMDLELIIMNAQGPFELTPATSLFVQCKTQEEIDLYWDTLLEGGKSMACGWLTDKYGVTWQIVPTLLWELMHSKDQKKAAAVTAQMMKMVKLDIAPLQKAYDEA